MLSYSRVIQGTQMKASPDACDGRQIPLPELDFLALNQPLGRLDTTPSSLLELILTEFCLGLSETKLPPTSLNRNKPGYSGIKTKYFITIPRMKNRASIIWPPFAPRLAKRRLPKRQNLPGWKLATVGTQVIIAGVSCPAKFSRCQQVPDNVSYCHVLSAPREKYFTCALVLNRRIHTLRYQRGAHLEGGSGCSQSHPNVGWLQFR
jgi:hypothetical protein